MDKPVKDCSHIYSDGRNVPVLFETDSDKIDGRNLIAVTALETGVVILMDIVMSTHFHTVATGTDRCRARFTDEMKRKLALRVSRLGIKLGGDGELHVRKDDIKTENELKTKIMYDYRNAIAAGYEMMPWHYPGGPGDIFFSNHSDRIMKGRLISELPVLDRRKMFHTRVELPGDWRYSENGVIIPDCYIDWRRLEKLFRSPKAAIAFMYQNKEKEAAEDAACAREFVQKLTEKDLRHIAKDYCQELFGKEYISMTTREEKITLAQRMWSKRCTYSVSALSRVTRVDKEMLEAILLPPQ